MMNEKPENLIVPLTKVSHDSIPNLCMNLSKYVNKIHSISFNRFRKINIQDFEEHLRETISVRVNLKSHGYRDVVSILNYLQRGRSFYNL